MDDQNPYARLGVERDADPKAIKKAYVTLIRQFPPETHPEEFKEIRAAYELLSDPEARARYDEERRDYSELSEVEAQALKIAEELIKKGKEGEAVEVYADLVRRQPGTTEGRLRLGGLLLNLGRAKEALAPLKELCAARPELGHARIQLALTYGALNQHSDAAVQLRQAVVLLPEELEPRMLLAECCKLVPNLSEADQVLAAAEAIAKTTFDRLKVLEVWICLRYWRLAEQNALGKLFHRTEHFSQQDALDLVRRFQVVARSGDAELLRFATIRLAAVAGRLIGNQQLAQANAVLGACAELQPDNLLLHPVPNRIELAWPQVPAALRTWLLSQKRGDGSNIVLPDPDAQFGIFWLAAVLMGSVVAVRRAIGAELPILDVFFWLATVGSGITAIYRSTQKLPEDQPRPMFVFHSFYLLHVMNDRLHLLPWLAMSDLNIVKNNSQYTLTPIFGNFGVSWWVWSEDQARGWAGHMSTLRRRLLEAMASGVLEALPEVELAPPASLPAKPVFPPRRYPLAAVAAVLALIAVVAVFLTMERERWEKVVMADDVTTYQQWVDDGADEEQRVISLARIASLEKERRTFLLETVDPAHPGIVALMAAADALPPGRELPVLLDHKAPIFFKELRRILDLHGGYLRVWPAPAALTPKMVPAIMVLTGQEPWEKIEIYVSGKAVFEHVFSPTTLSPAAQVADVLGLGRLPAGERWTLLGQLSKNPYAPAKKQKGVAP